MMEHRAARILKSACCTALHSNHLKTDPHLNRAENHVPRGSLLPLSFPFYLSSFAFINTPSKISNSSDIQVVS